MKEATKKYRPKAKVKVPAWMVKKLSRDYERNYAEVKTAHAEAMQVNFRTYDSIFKDGTARPDVIERVKEYLKQVA